MNDSLTADYLVIGAGVAGLSVARELATFAKVVVLEKEDAAGYHSSGRSAAIFVDRYGDAVIQGLSAASRPLMENPPFATDHALIARQRGLLLLASATSWQQSAVVDLSGLPTISAVDARAHIPILRPSAIGCAYWDPYAADIDVHELLIALQRNLKDSGGLIHTATEVTQTSRIHGVWQVTAGSLTVQAPIVVNAAGAWAGPIGELFGAPNLPLIPHRRTAATISPPPEQDVAAWPMVVDLEESIFFKPDAGMLMLSPGDATPVAPHDAFADDLDVAIAVNRFESLVDYSVRRVVSTWAGLRTLVPDGHPVIGFDPFAEGLFWLAGQGGFGIQTALGAAVMARELIAGGVDRGSAHFKALAPLVSPRRFCS